MPAIPQEVQAFEAKLDALLPLCYCKGPSLKDHMRELEQSLLALAPGDEASYRLCCQLYLLRLGAIESTAFCANFQHLARRNEVASEAVLPRAEKAPLHPVVQEFKANVDSQLNNLKAGYDFEMLDLEQFLRWIQGRHATSLEHLVCSRMYYLRLGRLKSLQFRACESGPCAARKDPENLELFAVEE